MQNPSPIHSVSLGTALIALVVSASLPACNDCRRPTPNIVDAARAPEIEAGNVELVVEDAGVLDVPDASDGGPKRASGAPGDATLAALRTCCAALDTQAKSLPAASPESGTLKTLAAQCYDAVKRGPGSAELAVLKATLRGAAVPPVCKAF